MANKKASSTKKSAASKSAAAETKVTTVKAVEAAPAPKRPTLASTVHSAPKPNHRPAMAAMIAEFVGTFIFAATVIAAQGQPILVLFALAGVVLTIGTLSGAYVNPALTIAAWVTRRMTALRAVGYLIAQVLGAMLALTIMSAYVSHDSGATQAQLYGAAPAELFKALALPEHKQWMVMGLEVLGTAIFGFAVAAASREIKERTAKAFTVGLGLYLGLMIAGSAAALIGASAILNPALAVALQVKFDLWHIGVYVIGSTIGAIVGFALYDLLDKTRREAA